MMNLKKPFKRSMGLSLFLPTLRWTVFFLGAISLMGCGGSTPKYLAKPRPVDPDDDALIPAPASVKPRTDTVPSEGTAAAGPAADVAGRSATAVNAPANATQPGNAPNFSTAFALADPAALRLEIEVPASSQPISAEESRRLSIIRMRKITAALVAFAIDKGRFPAASTFDNENIPALSWRVQILPYLGYQQLYSQFRMSEPYDSPQNSKLLASIPPVFQSPSRPDTKTNYLVVSGPGTLFAPGDRRGQSPAAITDGPGNTAILLEADDFLAVDWTRPVDYSVVSGDPRRGLSELREDGFFVGWADGTVGCWPFSAAGESIPGLFTIAGKEPPARNASGTLPAIVNKPGIVHDRWKGATGEKCQYCGGGGHWRSQRQQCGGGQRNQFADGFPSGCQYADSDVASLSGPRKRNDRRTTRFQHCR